MTRNPLRTAVLLLAPLAGPLGAQQLPHLALQTSPSPAPGGSVVWLVARPSGQADSSLTLDGAAAGEPLHFERMPDGQFRSLLGVPLDLGDTLAVRLHLSNGSVTDTIVAALPIRQPIYPNERLLVAPRYAEPDSAARARIEDELTQSRAISRQAHDTPRLWSGRFVRPRPSRITSRYGAGREFNGKVTSRHLGTDFAGAIGAPVRAAGRAVVALVANFYLAGHAVYLDHGGGLVTGYFHLSRVDVAAGDTVAAGQIIGAVGRSGRVTGPHLHWIARYGGITVDPMSLLSLDGKTEPRKDGKRERARKAGERLPSLRSFRRSAFSYPSRSCSTGCTPLGSAFPLLRFITCPTKNASSLVSPPL